QRWYHLQPDETAAPGDPLHWTGGLYNWDHMCAECHSTDVRKVFDPVARTFATTWSEIDVSCEACHGPGSRHVHWATQHDGPDPGFAVDLARRSTWTLDPGAPTARLVEPASVPHAQIDACGRCHARRSQEWSPPEHGRPLADTHRVALLDAGLYHADGQILDEVYVYGSFVQSRMFHAGVTCTDCHEPHAATLRVEGNALCTTCHRADVFDDPSHHHHEPGGAGGACVSCHMPATTYMGVDPRRDHGFRVPRPDLAAALGTPDVCTSCHADRDASWAASTVEIWRGVTAPARPPHFAVALDAGRHRAIGAGPMLRRVADDAALPAIVRATAITLLRDAPGAETSATIDRASASSDALLRRAAAGMLDLLAPPRRGPVGRALLADDVRTVRLETVAAMIGRDVDPAWADVQPGALEAYRASQMLNADRVEAWVNLARLELHLGRAGEAEAALRRAISIDPTFDPAVVNLADLLARTAREPEGEAVLRARLTRSPPSAATHHALGLSLIRQRRIDDAMAHLEAATAIGPDDARFAYVYAIALADRGDLVGSRAVLERAHARAPADVDVLVALLSDAMRSGRTGEARAYAESLCVLRPDDSDLREVRDGLRGPGR
ncbi:MAG: tetratricopeptide repeat protein, partial [Phycisphaerales bacterium]|nr:tetratricopeptide repeat protein [Phycisphaerales bacterium]